MVHPPKESLILLVEDDPDLRTLYRMTLRAAGYAVVAVEDGLDALAFAEQTRPAAVVLDLGLPRVHGRDVQRELCSQPQTRDIPIIVVTGDTSDVDEPDFHCVLRKPIDPEALVSAVQNCLRRR